MTAPLAVENRSPYADRLVESGLFENCPPPNKIFLVRHGQSIWNGTKRVSGQQNPPLSKKGREQARLLAQALQEEPLKAVITSSLARARETGASVAKQHNVPHYIRGELMELHLGILQGRFRDQRDPEAAALWEQRKSQGPAFRVPGGETFLELERRVIDCLRQIVQQAEGQAILIVGHRNTNRIVLGALLGWTLSQALAAKIRSKFLYEIVPGHHPTVQTLSLAEGQQKYEGLKL